MSEIRWVIQNNLINEDDLDQIRQECDDIGVEFQSVKILPYSDVLPKFTIDDKVNIYYGSTTFMYNLYNQLNKPFGLFYNHETYSMSNYLKQWGDNMLNSDASILTVGEFINSNQDPNVDLFIRPDGDGKEFDGQVGKFEEIIEWLNRYLEYDSRLSIDSNILVGPAYNIYKEWRLYIVDKEIVTVSRYRKDFKLSKSNEDVPESLIQFAKDRISEHTPHDNFALDIASVHDGTYYIIECGCLNSVGFYHADIKKIVKKVSEYCS